jgi:hypothetical protein
MGELDILGSYTIGEVFLKRLISSDCWLRNGGDCRFDTRFSNKKPRRSHYSHINRYSQRNLLVVCAKWLVGRILRQDQAGCFTIYQLPFVLSDHADLYPIDYGLIVRV